MAPRQHNGGRPNNQENGGVGSQEVEHRVMDEDDYLLFGGWVEEVAFHCSRMLQRANQTLKVIVRRVSAFDLGWSRGFSDYNVADS